MNKDLRIQELEAEVERLRAKLGTYGRPVKHHVTPNEVIGRLTAIQDLGRGMGLFKCFCGGSFKGKIHHIKHGEIKDCGCLRRAREESKAIRDKEAKLRNPKSVPVTVAGDVFGRLTTIRPTTKV